MKDKEIAALVERAIEPVMNAIVDIQIGTILACHERNAIDIETLRELLDLGASDASERRSSRSIFERVVAALPPRSQ